ncbi:hypothetical protein [Bradyrhizobium guangdongense]|uniref:hypothetical protein n=1 Tax=Bradyrhizobium guangdongense TaxID=1325090 RepID=UPI00131A3CE0|nr:hypothetical protein [Bradyrhizobium guangdongense]
MLLTAVYDLAVSPPTFDFVAFLVSAERRRLEIGADALEVVLMPGPAGGFRADQLPPFTVEARLGMRRNIVEAMCALLPSCRSIWILDVRHALNREQVFPVGYRVEDPISHYGTRRMIECISPDFAPLTTALPASRSSRVVSFSMRESSYWPTRNVCRKAWLEAARVLDRKGFEVAIIPDIDAPAFPDGPWTVNHVAATDLMERARVYETAAVNLFVASGPMCMALFMKRARSVVVRMEFDGAPCTNAGFLAASGLPPGSQLDRPEFHIAWAKEETPEIIVRCAEHSFERMAA